MFGTYCMINKANSPEKWYRAHINTRRMCQIPTLERMRFASLALFIVLVATLSEGLANFVLTNALKKFNKQYPGLASMSRSTRSSLTHAEYDGLSPKIKSMVQKYKIRANRPLPVWKTVNTINITWIKWLYWQLIFKFHNAYRSNWFPFSEFCIRSLFSARNDLEAIDQIYDRTVAERFFFIKKPIGAVISS